CPKLQRQARREAPKRRKQPIMAGIFIVTSSLTATSRSGYGAARNMGWFSSLFHTGVPPMADFYIGESLVGEGNEVAHIDLVIGSKTGPAGAAFTHALSNQKDGFTTLL